jgi:photosystem II stability/assembly factor-like uncharacterized protein
LRRELNESHITCVVSQGGAILAATKDGIYRSADAGDSWQAVNGGLTTRHIRWMAHAADEPQRAVAGSEPAGIYLSPDGGLSWQMRPEVNELRERNNWYLPYSPEAGCVRGFSFNKIKGYAAVEVGGVLYSSDSGETWTLNLPGGNAAQSIHPDVHSIAVHPSSDDLVAAPTGGGFYISRDGGVNWENRYPDCYCRAVWWHPTDPDWMVLGSADWVDRDGRIEQTRDGGLTWRDASDGLEVPWSHHMVERFLQIDERLLAVLSNGELLATPLDSFSWRQLLPEVRDIHAAAQLTLSL